MNIKNDLNLAFKPKNLSTIIEANFSTGIKLMSAYFGIWLAIHVVIAVINGLIDGKALGGIFLFSLLTGLAAAIIGIIGFLLVGLVGSYVSKLFKGTNDIQKTIGLVSYGVIPIFVISVVRDLILFISTLGNHFLASSLFGIQTVLFIITLIWLLWLSTEAIALADKIKELPALACFIIGFVVAMVITWAIRWVLVEIVTGILVGVL